MFITVVLVVSSVTVQPCSVLRTLLSSVVVTLTLVEMEDFVVTVIVFSISALESI